MTCTCDYSYTCDECRSRLRIQQMSSFHDEMDEWLADSIQKLAEKLGVEIDKRPEKPVDYW